MRKIILGFLLLLLTCGCQNQEVETINVLYESKEDNYTYVIPFDSTNTRNYHSTYQSRYDILNIGSGLEEYSLNYFSSKEYYAQEGQIIDRSTLTSLVGRESDSNAIGLNPTKGVPFEVREGISMNDCVIISDVMELDFIKKDAAEYDIDAMTLAIIVNETQTGEVNGVEKTYTIDEDRLWEYASNCGRKLESYLRTLDTVEDMPILVLIYNNASSDATLPGGFMGYGYFTSRTGQFTRVSEKWVLIPTSESNALDSNTHNEFLSFKSNLKEYLPESIGIVGKAQYKNEEISYLRITVSVQAKTYAEVKSLTQYCAQLSQEFLETNMRLVIEVNSNDETFALIEREAGSDSVEIMYVY